MASTKTFDYPHRHLFNIEPLNSHLDYDGRSFCRCGAVRLEDGTIIYNGKEEKVADLRVQMSTMQ
jgi:hypothetical protein